LMTPELEKQRKWADEQGKQVDENKGTV
jgi:hypothetical protein